MKTTGDFDDVNLSTVTFKLHAHVYGFSPVYFKER